jgi:uncharacterized protein (DUF58 family)
VQVRDGTVFHEMLHLRRGPAGWVLFVVAAGCVLLPLLLGAGLWVLLGLSVGLVIAIVTWFAGTETTVSDETVELAIRPWPMKRRIPLRDVVDAEIVIADANTTYFGGWEGSRGGLGGALVESVEGSRQVGNRSIRLHLAGHRTVQFATWRPQQALTAIRQARS